MPVAAKRAGARLVIVNRDETACDGLADVIVRGEADESFPRLLESLPNRSRLARIPGITYRDGSRVVRNMDAPPVLDLDALPLPAYHLLPGVRSARSLSLEIGRGCPFACTFCSTSDFFHRQFRLKSDSVVIAQMTKLESGATKIIPFFDFLWIP